MKFEIKQILFCVVFFALSCLSIAGQEQKLPLEIPTVAYCDLVREPALYDNKIVRVTANYFVAFEGSIMRDSTCDGQHTWVEFTSAIKRSTPPKIWKKFNRLTDAKPEITKDGGINHPSRQVNVTWVGLFRGIKPTQKIGELVLPIGFGHMNGFNYLFIAQKVESVSKTGLN